MTSLTIRMASPATPSPSGAWPSSTPATVPQLPVLVAEVGGELWAAVSLVDGHLSADPFRPTGELQFLLSSAPARSGAASAGRRPPGARVR